MGPYDQSGGLKISGGGGGGVTLLWGPVLGSALALSLLSPSLRGGF